MCGDAKSFAIEVSCQLIDESNGAFKMRRVKYADGAALFECEWLRLGGTLADLRRDFYAAYGEGVAEESQFIHCTVEAQAVVFQVVVGTASYDAHQFQMRITGPHVERALAQPPHGNRRSRR